MTILGAIEGMLAINMALFLAVFLLISRPPGLVERVTLHLQFRHPEVSWDALRALVERQLVLLGWLGCAIVFVWAMLTGFMFALYRHGIFWRW